MTLITATEKKQFFFENFDVYFFWPFVTKPKRMEIFLCSLCLSNDACFRRFCKEFYLGMLQQKTMGFKALLISALPESPSALYSSAQVVITWFR